MIIWWVSQNKNFTVAAWQVIKLSCQLQLDITKQWIAMQQYLKSLSLVFLFLSYSTSTSVVLIYPFAQLQLKLSRNTNIYKFFKPVWFHSPDAKHSSTKHNSTTEEVMRRPRKEREAVTSKGIVTAKPCVTSYHSHKETLTSEVFPPMPYSSASHQQW